MAAIKEATSRVLKADQEEIEEESSEESVDSSKRRSWTEAEDTKLKFLVVDSGVLDWN